MALFHSFLFHSFSFIFYCVCIHTHTHVHIYIYIYIYISHILIHSSVNGHLVCFQILASEKSAAMNLRVHVSFQIIVLLGYIPKSGFAGTHNSIFSLLRKSILFSIVAAPIYVKQI